MRGTKDLLEEGSSSSASPFDEETPSPSQQPSKDTLPGEVHFPPGFQLDLTCTVVYQDEPSAAPSPATVNAVEYSSKLNL